MKADGRLEVGPGIALRQAEYRRDAQVGDRSRGIVPGTDRSLPVAAQLPAAVGKPFFLPVPLRAYAENIGPLAAAEFKRGSVHGVGGRGQAEHRN